EPARSFGGEIDLPCPPQGCDQRDAHARRRRRSREPLLAERSNRHEVRYALRDALRIGEDRFVARKRARELDERGGELTRRSRIAPEQPHERLERADASLVRRALERSARARELLFVPLHGVRETIATSTRSLVSRVDAQDDAVRPRCERGISSSFG